MLVKQQISNSKTFKEISRTVNVVGININSDASSLDLYYRITYIKEGQDVSSFFNIQVPEWHIDNSTQILVRDESFAPKLNASFIENKDSNNIVLNENERYQTMPAFDYLKMFMLDMDVPLKTILSAYISEQDKDGRFDF